MIPKYPGFLFADIVRLVRVTWEQTLEDQGIALKLPQARALVYIERQPGLRQIDLAKLMEIQPITLVGIIDQLVGAELVERRADPKDRRAYLLFLTAKGLAMTSKFEPAASVFRTECMRGVSDKDAEIMFSVLDKILENMTSAIKQQPKKNRNNR